MTTLMIKTMTMMTIIMKILSVSAGGEEAQAVDRGVPDTDIVRLALFFYHDQDFFHDQDFLS